MGQVASVQEVGCQFGLGEELFVDAILDDFFDLGFQNV